MKFRSYGAQNVVDVALGQHEPRCLFSIRTAPNSTEKLHRIQRAPASSPRVNLVSHSQMVIVLTDESIKCSNLCDLYFVIRMQRQEYR